MSKLNQTVLVIGGAGYIGSHVVLELCEQGNNVTVFDNLSTGHKINVDSRAQFIKGDILSKNDLQSAFNQTYDAVFHFAALKAAGESMLEPGKYTTVNITGTINILNQMIECSVQNIIFSSTAAVYGLPEYLPINEEHSLKPINFYGFTKLEIERILHWYSQLKGISYAALRYFNAAGYDLDGRIQGLEKNPANLLPIVMETALGRSKSLDVFGNNYDTPDGTAIRDYIHVTDLASAHISSLEYIINKGKNITLNLASGKGYSVLDVIKTAEEITKNKIPYKIVGRREGDPEKLVAISKFTKDTICWECKYSDIETIIDSMWKVYKTKKLEVKS